MQSLKISVVRNTSEVCLLVSCGIFYQSLPRNRVMAASVLHVGIDDCNRALVLRDNGYSVEVCPTFEEFRSTIEQRSDAEAVLVTERPGRERNEIVTLTRSWSRAPLVLFSSSYEEATEFDLLIPPLVHPSEWLRRIATIIEQSRAFSAASQAIRDISMRSRQDSESLRHDSLIVRQRSATEQARAERFMNHFPKKPDPLR